MPRYLRYFLITLVFAVAISAVFAEEPAKSSGEGSGDNPIIFAIWEPDQLWYPGKIEKEEDGKLLIRFLDGDTQLTDKVKVARHTLQVGAAVYGNWKNEGLYYAGAITRVDGEKLRIKYEDGTSEDTTIKSIRMNLDTPALKQVGSRIMARWKADGYWYPASIIKTKEELYQVKYDDGTKEWLEESETFTWTVAPGDRVEGNWLGKGLYYQGTVTKRKGKNIHIRYDDGDEEDTTVGMVRMQLKKIPAK